MLTNAELVGTELIGAGGSRSSVCGGKMVDRGECCELVEAILQLDVVGDMINGGFITGACCCCSRCCC